MKWKGTQRARLQVKRSGEVTENAWDETAVREWADVGSEAKRVNEKAGKEVIKVHVASLMEVNVEKNSELPTDDSRRKF